MQLGTTIQFTASATNSTNTAISPTFTWQSDNTSVLDITPSGAACAGNWNAPIYTTCTPGGIGVAHVTATALGETSAPTLVFVHAHIDEIQLSVVPPVTSQPPACPSQTALPAACNIKFNTSAANYCLSQNQLETLQATAYSAGVDITSSVGPFTWSQVNAGVATVTPIVTVNTYDVPTNQATVGPGTPGQTQLVASSAGVSSQPYYVETCPVQCIDLELTGNGAQNPGVTSFAVNKGTSETITATAVDVQGCIVPKPALTWVSSAPAALTPGSTSTGCGAGVVCAVNTNQPGSAVISASCTPPSCNVGFPLNPAGYPGPYIPEPVYPVTAISGLVTGTPVASSVLASSYNCFSDPLCSVGLYSVPTTSTTTAGNATQLPTPPTSYTPPTSFSLLFDPAGDRAYMGSEFGAVVINPANIGGASSPFSSLAAAGTTLGLVTGKVLAVSPNGNMAIFADTVSTPNQVYVVSSTSSATPLNIDSAVAAAFSVDGLKAFILGDGGSSLYIYSTLQAIQPKIALPTPATSVVFNSTGTFALLSGGGAAGNLAAYNTCDNSPVTFAAGGITTPPLFLKIVPAGNVPLGSTFGNIVLPANLDPAGLDFFFGVDNTGLDIIATTSSLPLAAGSPAVTQLCPQAVTLAQITPLTTPPTVFAPVHIDINHGTFHPINFFLSPDGTLAYIITSDFGVLFYNFNTNSVSGIPLANNATPLAADITVDGTLIYIAGSDGMLHEVNTQLDIDQYQIEFPVLPNSASSFCYTGAACGLNIVAVKP